MCDETQSPGNDLVIGGRRSGWVWNAVCRRPNKPYSGTGSGAEEDRRDDEGPNPRNFTTSVTFNGPAKPISGRFRRFRLQRGSAALRNSSAPGTDRSLRSVLRGEARHPHRQRHDTVLSRVRRSLLRAVGYGDPAARRARWDQGRMATNYSGN